MSLAHQINGPDGRSVHHRQARFAPDRRGTVGEFIAELLFQAGVDTAFGVISIHNMPILDAIGRRGDMRFAPSRGEAGGLNMADAYARVRGGLGAAFTSTGTAAGNAAGAMVEAITAGSPVLHITGQIETAHLDKDRAYIHEAPRQLDMLKAISKAAFRIATPQAAAGVMQKAVRTALTAPTGPVSVEIPIDVQAAEIRFPSRVDLTPFPVAPVNEEHLQALIGEVLNARRPMLLLGGGARHAEAAATALADAGVGVVTTTNGRAIVPEDHAMSIGAFNVGPETQALYDACDLLLVVGSRLRSNETLNYKMALPDNTAVIDCDPAADGRCYANRHFVCGDANEILTRLSAAVIGAMDIDPALAGDIASARREQEKRMRDGLGPYTALVDSVQELLPRDAVWVRDVTISNSVWGNRYLRFNGSRNGVHALGGGIGQGVPMAVGAALGAGGRKVVALVGDGGTCLCLGEMQTLVEEKADVVVLMMNDNGYGVIKNIQDDIYGERRYFSDIMIPEFGMLCASMALPHRKISDLSDFPEVFAAAMRERGPVMIEIDMNAVGPMRHKFAGPPKKQP